MAAPIQSPAQCEVRSIIRFLNAKVNVQRKFTNRFLLFVVTLWIGNMWRSGAVNCPRGGLMFTTNNGAIGHLWSLTRQGRLQTSMTREYRSWFQDLINVWTLLATVLKNKVMYRQLVRRRWWGARISHDVVQRAGGRLLWLGDTEAGSKT